MVAHVPDGGAAFLVAGVAVPVVSCTITCIGNAIKRSLSEPMDYMARAICEPMDDVTRAIRETSSRQVGILNDIRNSQKDMAQTMDDMAQTMDDMAQTMDDMAQTMDGPDHGRHGPDPDGDQGHSQKEPWLTKNPGTFFGPACHANPTRYKLPCGMRGMGESGPAVPPAARSRKRKWVLYERRHSNAMWHVAWHVMRDPRMRGLNLVTFLDDASRCVTGVGLFTEATPENAAAVLRDAVGRFGAPAAILCGDGPCLVGAAGRDGGGRTGEPPGPRRPTAFEAGLLDLGIGLASPGPRRPPTKGKLGRFHRTLEDEMRHHGSLAGYVEYYNERRLHFSLDIANRQTPLMAFRAKRATEAIRGGNPDWMDEEAEGDPRA